MTQKQFKLLKEEYVEHIKTFVKEQGELFPHITIFANIRVIKEENDKKPALIHIPIPDEYMKNDESKDAFIDDIVPELFQAIEKDFKVYAVAWAAEATIRIPPKDFDLDKENYKTLPVKKDCIILTIESKKDNDIFLYEIHKGLAIGKKGLVDEINLIELEQKPKSVKGRFSGLFKNFNK